MKATELRINNLIWFNSKDEVQSCADDCTIDNDFHIITPKDICALNLIECENKIKDTNYESPEYQPISINKIWLKKFGFEPIGGKEWVKSHGIYPNQITILLFLYHDYVGLAYYKTCIRYIHELQNLYFALTGEELTIK